MPPQDSISKNVQNLFASLPKHWVVLVEVASDNLRAAALAILKENISAGSTALVLSSSQPCTAIRSSLSDEGIGPDKAFIVCTICAAQGKKEQDSKATIHLSSTAALTEGSIALSSAFKSLPSDAFFLLDSIPSLLIHNSPKVVARFLYCALTK
ncbi:hypothetical protein HYU19_01260, partial [Candidatus Woesearchaeota archaeon]|nr:hypothetical protein [Candidatus Woesearchaeota archaeon]